MVLARAHSTPSAAPSLSHQPALVFLPEAVTVANNLACRGLDHLEEKIPALQYPVEKVGHGWDSSLWDPTAPLWSPQGFLYGARCLWSLLEVRGCSGAPQSEDLAMRVG